MQIKLMYKIHCLNVAKGISHSAGNDTFYETYDEALEQARSYVTQHRRGSANQDSMVIYKAHVLVRPHKPPVEVLSISKDGETLPFGAWHDGIVR